jgi:hypothetical protein
MTAVMRNDALRHERDDETLAIEAIRSGQLEGWEIADLVRRFPAVADKLKQHRDKT